MILAFAVVVGAVLTVLVGAGGSWRFKERLRRVSG